MKVLEAVYEHGVLRPLEPLTLPEHQHVRLTLEEKSARLSWESTEPVNERREEMQWLAKESGPYAGEWVAIEGPRLVAHGAKLAEVRAAAKTTGASDPNLLAYPVTQTHSALVAMHQLEFDRVHDYSSRNSRRLMPGNEYDWGNTRIGQTDPFSSSRVQTPSEALLSFYMPRRIQPGTMRVCLDSSKPFTNTGSCVPWKRSFCPSINGSV